MSTLINDFHDVEASFSTLNDNNFIDLIFDGNDRTKDGTS